MFVGVIPGSGYGCDDGNLVCVHAVGAAFDQLVTGPLFAANGCLKSIVLDVGSPSDQLVDATEDFFDLLIREQRRLPELELGKLHVGLGSFTAVGFGIAELAPFATVVYMDSAPTKSNALRCYPGSFAETLVQLMKERKLSNKKLADLSLVGEKTIQRLRNDEEYPTSKQTVLGLRVGMSLPPPVANDFFEKSDFKLNPKKQEDYIYMCVLGACAENSIFAVNEMTSISTFRFRVMRPLINFR